jgi:LPXTG-motif cell wall-anchored protein
VIPEIPSNLMIGLLMLTLLGATVLARKRKVNK